jgi:hypothetical protein
LAAGVLAISVFVGGWPSIALAWSAAPLCLWLALGLRADDRDDENIDLIVDEHSRRGGPLRWILGDSLPTVYRVSTEIVVLAVINIVVAYGLEAKRAEAKARPSPVPAGQSGPDTR